MEVRLKIGGHLQVYSRIRSLTRHVNCLIYYNLGNKQEIDILV